MAMEGRLQRFGVRTKAQEQELHQRFVKDVHELCQFTITKLALCTSCLNSLDGAMHNYRTEARQTSANWEALENCVAMSEDILVHPRL